MKKVILSALVLFSFGKSECSGSENVDPKYISKDVKQAVSSWRDHIRNRILLFGASIPLAFSNSPYSGLIVRLASIGYHSLGGSAYLEYQKLEKKLAENPSSIEDKILLEKVRSEEKRILNDLSKWSKADLVLAAGFLIQWFLDKQYPVVIKENMTLTDIYSAPSNVCRLGVFLTSMAALAYQMYKFFPLLLMPSDLKKKEDLLKKVEKSQKDLEEAQMLMDKYNKEHMTNE